MAKKKPAGDTQESGTADNADKPVNVTDTKLESQNAALTEALNRFENLFEELTRFTTLIDDQDAEIAKANAVVAEAREAYDNAKKSLQEIEATRDGAKHNLYRFLSPKSGNFGILPLFDTMDEAVEEVHGANSKEWRSAPIAALKLSLPSLQALTECDVVMVGQLQDRVMKQPQDWWKEIDTLNAGSAGAIVDKLNNFIFEKTTK